MEPAAAAAARRPSRGAPSRLPSVAVAGCCASQTCRAPQGGVKYQEYLKANPEAAEAAMRGGRRGRNRGGPPVVAGTPVVAESL